MTSINRVLQIAQRELGVKEVGDNISKYGEWYGHDLNGQAWCAMGCIPFWKIDSGNIKNTIQISTTQT
jgi:hypothetical protein